MPLDLNNLTKAIVALETSIGTITEAQHQKMSADMINTLRAGIIQNFEVAYELCWKYIQRWISENKTPEDASNPRTRKDLFRMAAQYRLIQTPEPWFDFGNARNLTSHSYDEATAEKVFSVALTFVPEAKYLYTQLENHND